MLMAFKQVALKNTEIQGVPSPQTVNFQAAIINFSPLFLSQN